MERDGEGMGLDHEQLHMLAHALMEAGTVLEPIAPLTDQAPELTVDDAYEIASDIVGHRIADGRRIVGKKVGLTSAGSRKAFGIDSPAFGVILDDMTVRDGGRVKASSLIQPRIEADVAFRLKTPLQGPGVGIDEVLAATDYVFPALEIVDSRITGWRVKQADLVADNTAAALVVLGGSHLDPASVDLAAEEVSLLVNDVEVAQATGAEVLGNPAKAVAWLANTLGERGMGIAAGEFVLPGSLVEATPIAAGASITAVFTNLGAVSVRFIA